MEQPHIRGKSISAIMLCVLLSLLLHLVLALLLALALSQEKSHTASSAAGSARQRLVRVLRKPNTQQEPAEAQQRKPFAKTSADTPQSLPERTDYEGSRNSRAASEAAAEPLRSEKAAPAQHGEEKDEVVTFDQERQDGELMHEGQKPTPPPQPSASADRQPPAPEQPLPPAPGQESAVSDTPQPAPTATENQSAPGMQTADTPHPTPQGEQLLSREREPLEHPNPTPATAPPRGTDTGISSTPASQQAPTAPRPVFFDPSLAAPQPGAIGFRTHERKSRSSGRFILGKGAALNVAATPLGRYESEIYRRIAYHWYRACDEHRGDIIPGSITISLRLNKRGTLENMDLVRRHGAGVLQQSFTFRSIRRATLPPMPTTVQQEFVGDLLELIFTFNFD